ncbi:MAG: hypothetical protein E4G94_07675 [ANME-2 cluster archaeon]|nr:MAG: hypothetical protein E4G94_07675 [ANME-2 cluster archaeon]
MQGAPLDLLYNPIQTNGYRKMEIRKTKTDPIDSAIIALLSLPAMPDRAARWQPTL